MTRPNHADVTPPPIPLPRWLVRRYGLRRRQASLDAVLSCPTCGAALERAETGWVCPRMHGGIVPEGTLLERVLARLGRRCRAGHKLGEFQSAGSVLRFSTRLSRFLSRTGLSETDLYSRTPRFDLEANQWVLLLPPPP